MTEPHQALQELAELHTEYCPLLDALMQADENAVSAIVANEQRLGERIWTLGKIAFGPAAGGRLHMLRPIQGNEIDAAARIWLEHNLALDPEHFQAVQCCAVRAHRLGILLSGMGAERTPDAMKQAREMWREKIEDDGPPTARGEKSKRIREISAELGIKENTVKKAVQRMGTVPK